MASGTSTLLTKTIAKVHTQKKDAKSKPPSSLANLCTETLWKQSIDSGKAEELVAALRAHPEGLRALVADSEKHVTRVFVVNMAGMDDGVTEGTCGYVPLTAETSWFFKLLDMYNAPDASLVEHPLGGEDLRWDEVTECVDWMRQIVGDMEVKRARTFVLNALDIEVPKRNEDGELIEDVDEWLDENHEDWAEQFEDKFNKLFDEHTLRNGGMLTASAVRTLRKSGHPVSIAGVVSINLQNWN